MKYLNIHELIAVGIKTEFLTTMFVTIFWADALVQHANETTAVIDYEIESEGTPSAAFMELRKLSVEWNKRAQRWRDKQAKRKG